jgi:hypothetical protein
MVGHRGITRRTLAWVCGVAGLSAYNWWVLVPFKQGLLHSPDELFSNLEVTGQPYAIAMQRADIAAGVGLLAAFVLAGTSSERHREWLGMVVFALAGVIGGIFPQVCEDGIDAGCRAAERHFQLPLSQYLHDGAGVLEFAGVTLALWFAVRRTRGERTVTAHAYRFLAGAALIAYPLLGLSYLVNVLGAVLEAVFFIGFTTMVLLQLAEGLHQPALSSDHNSGMMVATRAGPGEMLSPGEDGGSADGCGAGGGTRQDRRGGAR